MNDFDFQTPIHNPKRRILGMTIPQLLLLGGIGVVQLIILVLGLKYIVLAPPPEELPTVTPLVITPLSRPTATATPIPDFSTALISSGDLPPGFVAASDDPATFDFNKAYPYFGIHPYKQFAYYGTRDDQYVIGWVFVLTNPAERDKFANFIQNPVELFASKDNPLGSQKPIDQYKLAGSFSVGDVSTGWIVNPSNADVQGDADFVIFSNENLGGVIKIGYKTGQAPVVDAWSMAKLLNDRLVQVQTSGPIPTPVVISLGNLTDMRLTPEDLPPQFEEMPSEEIPVDEILRAEMTAQGMQIVNVYGYQYLLTNHEEYVIGYTFLFTDTMGNGTMDAALETDPVVFVLLPPEGVQKVQSPKVNKSIGDRFASYAFMELSQTGNQRIDVIAFRRGHVGVVLYHAHYLGMWETTLEDPAVKMDIKIQLLYSP